MLEEIAEFIEALGLGPPWVLGTSMFAGSLPIEKMGGVAPPVRCLVVLENAGGALVPEIPDRVDKAIQLWSRGAYFMQARDDAKQLFKALHGTAGWNLQVGAGTNYLAMVIDGVSYPAPIENPDEKGNFIFSTNYIFRIEEAECG